MTRPLARPAGLRTASRIALIAVPVGMLIVLEMWLARTLDDHFAATILTLIGAVTGTAFAPRRARRR